MRVCVSVCVPRVGDWGLRSLGDNIERAYTGISVGSDLSSSPDTCRFIADPRVNRRSRLKLGLTRRAKVGATCERQQGFVASLTRSRTKHPRLGPVDLIYIVVGEVA